MDNSESMQSPMAKSTTSSDSNGVLAANSSAISTAKSKASTIRSTTTSSLMNTNIYNQSVNEAYVNVLKGRNVSDEVYKRSQHLNNIRNKKKPQQQQKQAVVLHNIESLPEDNYYTNDKENINDDMIEELDGSDHSVQHNSMIKNTLDHINNDSNKSEHNDYIRNVNSSFQENVTNETSRHQKNLYDSDEFDDINSLIDSDIDSEEDENLYHYKNSVDSEAELEEEEQYDYARAISNGSAYTHSFQNQEDRDGYISEKFEREGGNNDGEGQDDFNIGIVNHFKRRIHWNRVIICIVSIFCLILFMFHSIYEIPTINNLDKQIKELYKDRLDLDKSVSHILQQVEIKLRGKLNTNDNFQNQILNVTELEKTLYAQIENNFLNRLGDILPHEIPVIIKKDPENKDYEKLLILPEFEQYLKDSVFQLDSEFATQIKNIKSTNHLSSEYNELQKYDINNYIKEVFLKEYQFVDKEYFLKELSKNIEEVKTMVMIGNNKINELKQNNNNLWENEAFIKNIIQEEFLKELEKKTLYDSIRGTTMGPTNMKNYNNEYESGISNVHDELNYATFASGTRIVNHLCSKTFKGIVEEGVYSYGMEPIGLLGSYYGGDIFFENGNIRHNNNNNNNGNYWLCDISNNDQLCQWTIRFKQPIYLTSINYRHGRFKNNLSLMNSCPKKISLYVKFQNKNYKKQVLSNNKNNDNDNDNDKNDIGNQDFSFTIDTMSNDNSYVKVSELYYDRTNLLETIQEFKFPQWFIELNPLIKSVSFIVDDNYGNPYFISMNKFTVNGITPYDLQLLIESGLDELNSDPNSFKNHPHDSDYPESSNTYNDLPSFGDDDIIP